MRTQQEKMLAKDFRHADRGMGRGRECEEESS